jgi:hypothetical protein
MAADPTAVARYRRVAGPAGRVCYVAAHPAGRRRSGTCSPPPAASRLRPCAGPRTRPWRRVDQKKSGDGRRSPWRPAQAPGIQT